ncbi:MAG TPA: response regulator, partial [Chitinophagaceae bacterium]|nr:response regulator [Chitinophagaceae bacterium]
MGKSKNKAKSVEPSDKGINFAQPLTMKKKILVADDDPGIRDIFKIIFERAGYNIEIKGDAEEVLKNNFTIPDVFLIDKLLSGYDGLDICRYLKSNPLTSHIPVIMVSASPDIGSTAIKAGADDFVEKPFDLKYLLKVIERNISRVKNERVSRRVS